MSMQHSRRRESGYLKVLGIGCLVIVVLLIVGGVVVVMNIKSIASSAAAAMIKNVVQESDLPAEQKDRIVKQVDRVTLAYKAGTISDDQLGTIMEKLGESALLPLGMVYAFEDKHITPSDMTADEKQAAKRSLQRFARGVFEETIDPWAVQEVFALVSTTDGQGNQQFKEQLTRQELDAALTAVEAKADEAQVPDEPFEVDIAGEIEKAVDEALEPASDPVPVPIEKD